MTALLFVAGLVLLVVGGELLVRGAARLAARLGISPLVIGLTVVAFGTSSPELAVSVQAGFAGQVDIAVGNVVGSNIFNVLFILGLSALIVPLVVSEQLVRLDVPIMVAVSILFLLLCLDGMISRMESGLLTAGLVGYIVLQIVLSRRAGSGGSAVQRADEALVATPAPDRAAAPDNTAAGVAGQPAPATGPTAPEGSTGVEAGSSVPVNLLLIAGGLALLVLGSRWLVQAAVSIAQLFGVSQLVIGLTIVAIGTSMPEVATSVVAGIRGQRDIAVGNVIGSNIFNILAVLGISGLVTPGGMPVGAGVLSIDMPIMVAVALLCLPIFISHFSITRWEGLLFLAYYGLYTTYIILDAGNHHAVSGFRTLVLTIVLPLTLLTLLGFSTRAWMRDRDQPS